MDTNVAVPKPEKLQGFSDMPTLTGPRPSTARGWAIPSSATARDAGVTNSASGKGRGREKALDHLGG